MSIEIIANEHADDALQIFLKRCDRSFVYATPAFMAMIAAHLRGRAYWLVMRRSGGVVGLLPFMVKEGALGAVYNSLAYYGSNGGVIQLTYDKDDKRQLIEYFYEAAEKGGAVTATLISNPLEECVTYEQFSKYDLRDERIGQITCLPDSESGDSLMKLFDDPRPRNIRKALREGVIVTAETDKGVVDFLYDTHRKNMAAIGGLPKRESFFRDISCYMANDQWQIYVGRIGPQAVAALLVFYNNQTVEYFTPVIVEEYRGTQALALVVYEAMLDAVSKGFKYWNWGGTWLSQGGVYDFKKKWGTTDHPYYYYTRVFDPKVRKAPREQLLSEYEGFFVLPFSALEV
ncbi:GNAT family N-acetyltransferase [Ectopseudomonas khazarica]|uniref:GNAT family N-acetyltransferase n=1 Tax=Ectopseudomonas khazarica TaxID=2502979 RepID=UPI003B9557C2